MILDAFRQVKNRWRWTRALWARLQHGKQSAGTRDYEMRVAAELATFNEQHNVHELPPIFHYWSNRYLRPWLEQYGYSNPDQFFAHYLTQVAGQGGGHAVSLGAGNGDTELRVAQLLAERGVPMLIECLELNPTMIERGQAQAQAMGLTDRVRFTVCDLNRWQPSQPIDAVIANQSLHHFVNLEQIFDTVRAHLRAGGLFMTSDMIGRNGHQRWPEALAHVQRLWAELPRSYRYNLQLRRQEDEFADWDCSVEGFEGIRAQDILPLLLERFSFQTFIAWGNLIDPFIDRSFGHHFNVEQEWDRAFIDQVHALDEQEILAGRLTPTHLMGVMTVGTPRLREYARGLDPARCVRRA